MKPEITVDSAEGAYVLILILMEHKMKRLMINVNEKTKTVEAYSLHKLEENKPIAKDWSNKVSNTNIQKIDFHGEYGVRNYIKASENKVEGFTDETYFVINDNTLAQDKDLLNLNCESGKDIPKIVNAEVSLITTYSASIPVYLQDEELNISYQNNKKFHLVMAGDTINLNWFWNGANKHIGEGSYPVMTT